MKQKINKKKIKKCKKIGKRFKISYKIKKIQSSKILLKNTNNKYHKKINQIINYLIYYLMKLTFQKKTTRKN